MIKMQTKYSNHLKAENTQEPSLWSKFLIFYLYLVQGFFYGFSQSIPLCYIQVPTYRILGMFSMTNIPFSLKFVIAPFEQKYTSHSYGKRKTWIVLSLIMCGLFLCFLSSAAGKANKQIAAAILLFGCYFFTAVKDIAVDGLSIQLIKDTRTINFMALLGQEAGRFITLSVFLSFISTHYWKAYGIHSPLLEVHQFIWIIVIIILGSVPCIHFLFRQQQQQNAQHQKKLTFWQVLKHYKYFFNPKYIVCRQSLLLIFYNQGLSFFQSSYGVQLIKKGIQKETLMFLQNLCIIPTIICTYILNKYFNKISLHKLQFYFFAVRLFLSIAYFILDFRELGTVQITYPILIIFRSFQYYNNMNILNEISIGNFSGMTITMLLSAMNFGNSTYIQIYCIDIFGYRSSCIFGFIYSAFAFILLPRLIDWALAGKPSQDLKVQ